MRILAVVVIALCLAAAPAVFASLDNDVSKARNCRHCGMDRGKFSHSRMMIEYDDGSTVGICSLHCAAVELANTIDRTPVALWVADYDTKELVDAEQAVWVVGGSKKGVMTRVAKWTFGSRDRSERFIKSNGGRIVTFDEAMKAAYDDMYQDSKMIREMRKLKRGAQRQSDGHP